MSLELRPSSSEAFAERLRSAEARRNQEPGVRHALPAPYVPQCYATEWRSGQYCEFRPANRHYRN